MAYTKWDRVAKTTQSYNNSDGNRKIINTIESDGVLKNGASVTKVVTYTILIDLNVPRGTIGRIIRNTCEVKYYYDNGVYIFPFKKLKQIL